MWNSLCAAFRRQLESASVYGGSMIRFIKRLGAVVGVLAILAFALIGILTVTRGTPVRRVLAVGDEKLPGVRDSLFIRSLELFSGMKIENGNAAEVLANGAVYPRLWADIHSATQTV